ncbi:MAG: glycoside hydrolase family 73 protein [Chitinophagaceae bacterium]
MATFSSVVKRYRQQGYGRGSAATAGAVDLLKERIDPRRFLFKPDGIMTTLFPGLKPFRAKGSADATDKSLLSTGVGSSPILNDILITSQATAKNTLVLPSMARDMFLVRENIAKLVRLQGGTPRTKAGDWFERQAARENAYESKFQKMLAKQSALSPTKEKEKDSGGFLNTLLKGLGILDIINQFKNLLPLLGMISSIGVSAITGLFSVLVPLLIGGAFIAGIVKLVDLIESGFFDKYAETLKNLADKMNEKLGINKRIDDQREKNRDMLTHSDSTKAFRGPEKDAALQAFEKAVSIAENAEQRASAITGLQNYRKGMGLAPLNENELPVSKYQQSGKLTGDIPDQAKNTTSKEEFIGYYKPLAVAVGKELGISAENILAQWGLETGWGKSIIPGTNNLGNIKDPTGQGPKAFDKAEGSRDSYAKFSSLSDFGSAYVSLIKRNFPEALNSGDNSTAFTNGLKNGRVGAYATDPNYASKIASTVSSLKSTQLAGTPVPSSTGNTVNNTSKEVAVAQRTETNKTAAPVVIADNKTINNTKTATTPPPPSSPYNEDLFFESMFKSVIG